MSACRVFKVFKQGFVKIRSSLVGVVEEFVKLRHVGKTVLDNSGNVGVCLILMDKYSGKYFYSCVLTL